MHDGRQKIYIVTNAINAEIIKCGGHGFNRGCAVGPMRYQLGNHRVIKQRYLAAFINTGIIAHGNAVMLGFFRWAVA